MSYSTSYKLQMKFATAEGEDAETKTWTFGNIDTDEVTENAVLSLASTMVTHGAMYPPGKQPVSFVSGTLVTSAVVAFPHT